MPQNYNMRLTSIISACSLILFILFAVVPVSALPAQSPGQAEEFELEPAVASNDLEPADVSVDLKSPRVSAKIEPVDESSHINPGPYQYGDVIRRLYGSDVQLLRGKTLDAIDICSSDIVNPLTVEGWHYSGAGSFIRQWSEASKKTPGFEEHAKKQGFDFRSKFLNDVLKSINPPKCHIHTPCVPLACKDIVNNLMVPDPAIAMAVMYTDKHMVDFLTVADAQLQLFDHAETELKFSANDIVKRFTWREDNSITAHCNALADQWMTAIQTVVVAIGSLAGTAGTVIAPVAGTVAKVAAQEGNMVARQMGTTLARQIGPSAPLARGAMRNSQALVSAPNAVGLAARPAIAKAGEKISSEQAKLQSQKWGAYALENTWGIGPAAINNLVLKPQMGGLAAFACKNIAQAAQGSDDNHYVALFNALKDRFSEYRMNTEHETLRIKEDQVGGNGKWGMVDYLEAGSFFLNSAAEEYFLDNQEDSRKRLTDYMQSIFAISTMRNDGSGVHCTWLRDGCNSKQESTEDSKYCVEKDVLCQAFSWLPYGKHQYKVPHWGHQYLDHEGGSQIYGFDTKNLVEKSWAYYKNKAFEPGRKGDLMNDAYQLMGEDFSQETPVHLPVCFDPEGYYHLRELGNDPVGPDKLKKHRNQFESAPPCSCGFSGEETEQFLRDIGLFKEDALREISYQCYNGVRQSTMVNFRYQEEQRNGLDLYWTGFRWVKRVDPFQTYNSHCTMTSILENFASESKTKPIKLTKDYKANEHCAEVQALHKKFMLEQGMDSIDATCTMYLEDPFVRAVMYGVGDSKYYLGDQYSDFQKVCQNRPKRAHQKIDPSYLPKNLKTDSEVSVDTLQSPLSLKDIGPKQFLCHVPKPWLKEKLPQKCIDMAAEFYKGRSLPEVNQYGFLETTARSEFAVVPKDGGVRE